MSGPREHKHRGSMYFNEARAMEMHDAGLTCAEIRARGIPDSAIVAACNYRSETGSKKMVADFVQGSADLFRAIAREHPERVTAP